MTHWDSPVYRSRDDNINQTFQRPQNQDGQAGEKDMLCVSHYSSLPTSRYVWN